MRESRRPPLFHYADGLPSPLAPGGAQAPCPKAMRGDGNPLFCKGLVENIEPTLTHFGAHPINQVRRLGLNPDGTVVKVVAVVAVRMPL